MFEYEPLEDPNNPHGPLLRELHIRNTDGALAKCLVLVKPPGREESAIDATDFPVVRIESVEYHAVLGSHGAADLFFRRAPMMRMIYRLLIDDLERHYNIGLISAYE